MRSKPSGVRFNNLKLQLGGSNEQTSSIIHVQPFTVTTDDSSTLNRHRSPSLTDHPPII